METSLPNLFFEILFYVLILPMRNGNSCFSISAIATLILVLILPMRNGNKDMLWITTQKRLKVLILPMRNGNCEPPNKS